MPQAHARLPPPNARAARTANSRIVSSIQKRLVRVANRLFSTSDWSVSRSAPTTRSAASSVQPPAKTERRAKRRCSAGESSSYDHAIVARSVCWRGSQVAAALEQVEARRQPLDDLRRREHARPRSGELDGEWQVVEAAAELGRPSRPARAASGRRRARPPPASASGGTGYSSSPRTRSSSRLVTSRRRLGQASSSVGELGRRLDDLLEVVEEEEQLTLADVGGEPVLPRRASAPTVSTTSRGSRIGASGPRTPRR